MTKPRKIVAAHGNFDEAHVIDKVPEQAAPLQKRARIKVRHECDACISGSATSTTICLRTPPKKKKNVHMHIYIYVYIYTYNRFVEGSGR